MACPLCGKKDKLYISRTTGRFICFVCREDKGFQGKPEYALSAITGEPVAKVREFLQGSLKDLPASPRGIVVRFDELIDEEDIQDVAEELPPELRWPFHCLTLDRPGAKLGAEYVAGRGVQVALAREYDVRYSPERRSVVFPVCLGGRLVGWQYRVIDPTVVFGYNDQAFERLKTVSSDDIPRDRALMFQHRLAGSAHAVLLEGPFDALAVHGFGGNVASMGKTVTPAQVELVGRSGVQRVYVGLDPDAASEVEPLVQKFKTWGVELYRVVVPKGFKDLGEMPPEDACRVVAASPSLSPGKIHVYFRLPRGMF